MDLAAIFVISDLHVGVGDKFDICRSPQKLAALVAFIEHVRAQPTPVELVVNGDIVDFLRVEPWNNYGRSTALAKITVIVEESADVFKTIGRLLQDPRHRITILLGNHDVELAFPEVWAVLRDGILAEAPAGAGRRLALVDEHPTHRTNVNGVCIHIEHGNVDDAWNAINYQWLVDDVNTGTSASAYPLGTKLIYKTVNGVKEYLQFVEVLNLKSPAMKMLLLVLQWRSLRSILSWGTWRLLATIRGWFPRLQSEACGLSFGKTSAERVSPPSDLSHNAASGKNSRVIPSVIPHWKSLKCTQPPLATGQRPVETPVDRALEGVKVHLVAIALWGLLRVSAIRDHGSDFVASDHRDDPLVISAHNRLKGIANVAVFGHTHEAMKTEFDDGWLYVNSGAWTNRIHFPRSTRYNDLLEWMRKLADNTFDHTFFPTFVRIDPCASGAIVGLFRWDENGPEELWKKCISRGAFQTCVAETSGW